MLTVTDTESETETGTQAKDTMPKAVRAVVMDYILATLEHDRLAYEWTEGPSDAKGEEDDTVRAAQLEAAMSAKSTAWVALCETFGVHP